MFEIVLHMPRIPPNTGNIMRLCANTGARLHLVEPIGFEMTDRRLRRAGMDYRERATVRIHDSWSAVRSHLSERNWYALATCGPRPYYEARFESGDVLVFGSEQVGLPPSVLADFHDDHQLHVPMVCGSRSLNLSNAVAAVLYEAWRQIGFRGARAPGSEEP